MFDRSSPDLTAHAVRAWSKWLEELPSEAPRLRRAIERAVSFLAKTQRMDGSWLPLWFGNQHAPDDINPTYGTARVILGLQEMAARHGSLPAGMLEKARQWLVQAQNSDGSWGGYPKGSPSVEETALAVEALASFACEDDTTAVVSAGVAWLMEKVESGEWLRPSPIGFYFAKLWYLRAALPDDFHGGGACQGPRFPRSVETTQRSRLASERSSFARRFLIVSTSLVSSKTVR